MQSKIIELPSKGFFYDLESPLSEGNLEIKVMTAKEEDILSNRNFISKGIVIDKLLESIILTKNVDYRDLLLYDIDAILLLSRIFAFGNEYDAEAVCPSCGEKQKINVDLSEITFKELDETLFIRGKNEFNIETSFGNKLKCRFLTKKLENELLAEIKALKRNSVKLEYEPENQFRLAYSILEFNGEINQSKIRKIIADLPLKEVREIKNKINKIAPGLNLDILLLCSNCGAENYIPLPIGVNFFWF